MNRNANGILVAQNLPRAKKQKKLPKVTSKKATCIPNEHKPVVELMRPGIDETSYAAMYILTPSEKEVAHYLKRKFTVVEQPVKEMNDSYNEWLNCREYVNEADVLVNYAKSEAFTIADGEQYRYMACCHLNDMHVHRYDSDHDSLLIFTRNGQVTEIKYFLRMEA